MNNTVKQRYYVGIDKEGTKRYYVNKVLHRDGSPAIEHSNGNKYWYKNGKLHREDGPAVEYTNGAKYWYKNDNLHMEDGPAIEYADGTKGWWLNDIYYGKNVEFTNESWIFFVKTLIFS